MQMNTILKLSVAASDATISQQYRIKRNITMTKVMNSMQKWHFGVLLNFSPNNF